MNTENRLLRIAANAALSREVQVVWEPLIWGAEHIDLISKVLGQVPCDATERNELKLLLLKEKRYELYVAMMYCDCVQKHSEVQAPSGEKPLDPFTCEDDSLSRRIVHGQLLSFLRWCDADDESALIEKNSALEIYRLCYIAIAVGYGKLAFALISNMDEQTLQDGGAVFTRYGGHQKALLKKWIRDFVRKQPPGRYRKRLMKRLVRYDIPVLRK